MAKLSQTVLSARLTNEGRWAEWLHGIWFRVLPITHSSFQTALTKAREPFKSAIAAAPNNEEVGGILLRTVEETLYLLLTGCANVEHDDGSPVEFTQEWAREVCARVDMDHLPLVYLLTGIVSKPLPRRALTRATGRQRTRETFVDSPLAAETCERLHIAFRLGLAGASMPRRCKPYRRDAGHRTPP